MNDYEIFQKRLSNRGVSVADRLVADKLKSFQHALIYAYNSEIIDKDGVLSKALINNEKLQMDYDQKVISSGFENGYKVGDIIYWKRTDTRWLIISQQMTERAYFKASIKKALYKIKWRGDNDKTVYEQWAALLGPVETKLNEQIKNGLGFDVPNDTLTLWMGASEATKSLNKYDKIMIANKIWKINVIDDITTPSLVNLHLIADLKDNDKDNVSEGIARDYEHMIEVVEEPSAYTIEGPQSISPVRGLVQNYTIEPSDVGGSWSIDSTFATIVASDVSSATVQFNSNIGTTELIYTIADTIVAKKTIKITSLFG